ncbi:MAG TPA: hypothetical protein VE690_10375 [Rhodopila sp.]|nr:hypothetical protein [Rhodopila sp.]
MTRHNRQATAPLTAKDDPSAPGYDAAHHQMEAETPRPRRVLLIEDHPAALALLAMWLGDHGFNVQEFENLQQAMQSLDDRSWRPVH